MSVVKTDYPYRDDRPRHREAEVVRTLGPRGWVALAVTVEEHVAVLHLSPKRARKLAKALKKVAAIAEQEAAL